MGTGLTKTKVSTQRRLICPRGREGIRDKDRKQRTREKGKGTRSWRDICPRPTKDWLWIESRQTHRQTAVYKGKGETPELVCFDRACKLG